MTTSQWFAIAAIGRDRPGIVADLSECVFECGCNLEDASMTMLGSEFATLMLVSGTSEDLGDRLYEATKRLEWERRLTVFIRPLDSPVQPEAPEGQCQAILSVTGLDQAGLVAGFSRCVADHDGLITDLRGSVANLPQSGTPLYTLTIRLSVPSAARETLESAVEDVAGRLDVDASWENLTP